MNTTPLAYDLAFAATVCLPAVIFAAALCAGLAVRRLTTKDGAR